jgi:tetratricopeptide (TPR) repeat protein
MKIPFRLLPVTMIVLAMSACSTMDNPKSAFNSAPLKPADYIKPTFAKKADPTNAQMLLRSGTEYLQQGDLQKAHGVFSVALKLDINNAGLHFLNGLTYQMMYEAGDEASYDLAVTGYNTALSLDRNLEPALLQLGKLHLVSKKYVLAQQAFSEAYERNSNSTPALMGLAQASILAGDMKSGYWATVQLDAMNFKSPEFLRLKAIQAALAQSPQAAKEFAKQYELTAKDQGSKEDADYVNSRVDKLLTMKTSFGSSGLNGVLLAQADTGNKTKEAAKEAAPEAPKTAEHQLWWRCDPNPGLTLQKDGLPQLQLPTSEENATTLTLPRPCTGEKPPMAMIEVTMIRTEESMTRNQGINLLDGLKMIRDTFSTADRSRVIGNDDVIATTAASLVYSLNIANSLFAKNEVIARPSLSAVDRLPSVFFSGRTVSIGIGSTGVGYALVDKSVGTSLSITPTFVDEENVLLSIRSSRSFIEPSEGNTIALIQSRNAVNASARVKFGQTYVLNGMIEREKDNVNSGVPVLMDIPIIQNLFSKSVKIDFNRQILTLVTVRRLVDDSESAYLAKNPAGTINGHKLAVQVQEFMDLQSNQTVMDEVLSGLRKDNTLYMRLRNRDVIQESYSSQSVIQRILMDLKELAYF